MKRFTSIVGSLALVASLAACGNNNGSGNGTITGNPDMSTTLGGPDLAMAAGDMAMKTGALTGEACKNRLDCQSGAIAGQTAICETTLGQSGVMWQDGYCSSKCRMGRDDDCPGVNAGTSLAVCDTLDGTNYQCLIPCQTAATDCRQGYVCANVSGDPTSQNSLCFPGGESQCDFTTPKACTDPTTSCVSYSPDGSYGQCEAKCDVFKQDCAPVQGETVGCLFTVENSGGNCVAVVGGGGKDGDACHYANGCDPGLACTGSGVCHPYCRTGANAVACPSGETCMQLQVSGGQTAPSTDVVGECQ